jgi:hypothetical protein
MRRGAATLVLAVLACNAGDRDGGPLTGSAGLSAGESASTTNLTTGISDGESSAPGSTSDDPPSSTDASGDEAASDATTDASAGSTVAQTDDTSGGASTTDAETSAESSGGLADGILDVTITAHDDCTFTVVPASITVPEGTEFTVNWVSSAASEVEFDIAKIDDFNQVPIILGMEPGTSYHDDIREWCGDLFTGTFDFRLTSCFDDHYIPVDCGG